MTRNVFDYTGAVQTYTVPDGVFSLIVELMGAGAWPPGSTGSGGYLQGRLAVHPGDVLNIYVGGVGGTPSGQTGGVGGWNGGGNGGTCTGSGGSGGGGGGGASDIRFGGTALTDRIAVAGGA